MTRGAQRAVCETSRSNAWGHAVGEPPIRLREGDLLSSVMSWVISGDADDVAAALNA